MIAKLILFSLIFAMFLYIPLPTAVNIFLRRKFTSTVVKSGLTCLTFDDGPDPDSTREILDLLEENDARATFFLLGEKVEKYPELVEMIISRGHEVGEHGYRHAHPWKSGPIKTAGDLIRGGMTMQGYRNSVNIKYFRPPFGKFNLVSLLYLWLSRKKAVFWDIDGKDYHESSGRAVAETVLRCLGPGSVVLLHDGRRNPHGTTRATVAAVKLILDEGGKMGVSFATIGDAFSRAAKDKENRSAS